MKQLLNLFDRLRRLDWERLLVRTVLVATLLGGVYVYLVDFHPEWWTQAKREAPSLAPIGRVVHAPEVVPAVETQSASETPDVDAEPEASALVDEIEPAQSEETGRAAAVEVAAPDPDAETRDDDGETLETLTVKTEAVEPATSVDTSTDQSDTSGAAADGAVALEPAEDAVPAAPPVAPQAPWYPPQGYYPPRHSAAPYPPHGGMPAPYPPHHPVQHPHPGGWGY